MNLLINRDAVLKIIKDNETSYLSTLKDISMLPAIQAPITKHAHWYQKQMTVPKGKGQIYLVWSCSACHKHERKRSDYCPNCGAVMDEGE
jgi:hypothetical protein